MVLPTLVCLSGQRGQCNKQAHAPPSSFHTAAAQKTVMRNYQIIIIYYCVNPPCQTCVTIKWLLSSTASATTGRSAILGASKNQINHRNVFYLFIYFVFFFSYWHSYIVNMFQKFTICLLLPLPVFVHCGSSLGRKETTTSVLRQIILMLSAVFFSHILKQFQTFRLKLDICWFPLTMTKYVQMKKCTKFRFRFLKRENKSPHKF